MLVALVVTAAATLFALATPAASADREYRAPRPAPASVAELREQASAEGLTAGNDGRWTCVSTGSSSAPEAPGSRSTG